MRITVCKFLSFLLFLPLVAFKNDRPAYMIYSKKMGPVAYEKMLKSLKDADVVFFGELHNNPISHWLQLEVSESLYKEKGNSLILAAEMFESDDQLILNEYLQDIITEKNFEASARLWVNYKTDYRPLVRFAKKNRLNFIATSMPGRYASIVFKKGFNALEDLYPEAKKLIAPIPIDYDPELGCYKNINKYLGIDEKGHPSGKIAEAQAVKDATMAFFIYKNFSTGKLVLHFNGNYHSDNHEGIVWYLNRLNPGLRIATISTVLQDDISSLEKKYEGRADFIICVPLSMTVTH